jgi:precorrin-6B methylase 2
MKMFNKLLQKIKKKWTRKAGRYQRKKQNRLEKRSRAVFYCNVINYLFADLTVRNGVFKGLRYPGRETVCSVYVPKLIGSYEREIQPVIESLCSQNIQNVVNVGCAEGYYAVGLARLFPQATVYAFDIDEEARALCKKMAEVNEVQNRVIVGEKCDPQTLKKLPLDTNALIVCDCEGYEKNLFSKEIIPYLANCRLLVEVHDVLDITISSELMNRFQGTHEIEVIESIDDIKKARLYRYPELERYSLDEKKLLFAEYRGAMMEWFYMTPR